MFYSRKEKNLQKSFCRYKTISYFWSTKLLASQSIGYFFIQTAYYHLNMVKFAKIKEQQDKIHYFKKIICYKII